MLLPKKSIFSFVLAGLSALVPAGAEAGLYGFTLPHPYTYEEELLDIDVPPLHIPNYRSLMRDNLLMLIDYAKAVKPDFKIVAHEGVNLLHKSLWEHHLEGYNEARRKGINADDPSFLERLKKQHPQMESFAGTPAYRYLNSLDAIAVNNLYCGKRQLPEHIAEAGLPVIAIDRCATERDLDKAIVSSIVNRHLFYGFTDPQYAFNDISRQPVINESAKNVDSLRKAANFLLLNDDRKFADKNEFIEAVRNSNFDVIVITPLFRHNQRFSNQEIRSMKFKKNGTQRILLAEMNVSEADALSYYWQHKWKIGSPDWLVRQSFVNDSGYLTKYWTPEWQKLMSGYFKSIIDNGFDGVFFTGIDNHRYFEKQTPLE